MKLTITCDKNETLESIVAFGTLALLPYAITQATKFDEIKHDGKVDNMNCFKNDEHTPKLRKLCIENNIESREVVNEALGLLFDFDYGAIARSEGECESYTIFDINGNKIDGLVVDCDNIDEKIISHSELVIDLGVCVK